MADLNNITVTGRLGADAVVKTTPNGKYIMEVPIAVNIGYGDYRKTIWFKVKQFGERVNNIVGLFTKGSLVAVSGEFDTDEWTGKDSVEHKDLVIKASSLNLLYQKADESKPQETVDESDVVVF
jgi:single-strand DNA-binding protein